MLGLLHSLGQAVEGIGANKSEFCIAEANTPMVQRLTYDLGQIHCSLRIERGCRRKQCSGL